MSTIGEFCGVLVRDFEQNWQTAPSSAHVDVVWAGTEKYVSYAKDPKRSLIILSILDVRRDLERMRRPLRLEKYVDISKHRVLSVRYPEAVVVDLQVAFSLPLYTDAIWAVERYFKKYPTTRRFDLNVDVFSDGQQRVIPVRVVPQQANFQPKYNPGDRDIYSAQRLSAYTWIFHEESEVENLPTFTKGRVTTVLDASKETILDFEA
jgi:hypothetical protein